MGSHSSSLGSEVGIGYERLHNIACRPMELGNPEIVCGVHPNVRSDEVRTLRVAEGSDGTSEGRGVLTECSSSGGTFEA